MTEIAKLFERAEKFLQKGRHEAALQAYLEVLELEPAHEPALQAAANLCISLGRRGEGVALLFRLFERQLANTQSQAALTYRKLLKLAPVPAEQSLQVARLLEKNNRKEALEVYGRALREFMAAGRFVEAISVLETIIALEPSVASLEQLARLSIQVQDSAKAIAALLRAGKLQEEENPAGAFELFQRAYQLDQSHVPAALAYARGLLANETTETCDQAAQVLKPFASGPLSTSATRALYGRALLAAGHSMDAEPFLRDVFDDDASQVGRAVAAIGKLLDAQQASEAVQLARRIEEYERQAGRLREHATAMQQISEKHLPGFAFLQYLVELFNATNREHDYCSALLRLFEFYYAEGNYLKAGECLDRAAEIDPYEDGHKHRLQLLTGKLDNARLRIIANRLLGAVTAPDEKLAETAQAGPPATPLADTDTGQEPTVLEDLILQAEIFLRYSMRTRAIERLERIRHVFPGEELKNEKLHRLLVAAGLAPMSATPGEGSPGSPSGAAGAALDNLTRLNQITHNLARQGSVKSVLFTAVNEAGRYWNASRCIAVLCSPGKPPSIALEYCAAGEKGSDVHAIVKLVGLLQPLVLAHGPLAISRETAPAHLEALKQFAAGMRIAGLMAMPLMETEQHVGLLILAHNDATRNWTKSDLAVLKTIADQAVLAVSNVRLRRLVKNLAVTEEHSGLFKRSSYCDLLVAEVSRASQQQSTATVLLMNFGKASELIRQMGASAVDTLIQQLAQLVCSHIRQNDIAVRYDLTTLAVVLGDTNGNNAQLAADKLRRVLANMRVPSLTVGIAEAAMRAEFDPVDVVTELINRVEAALQQALGEGGNRTCVLAPELSGSVCA